MADAVYFMRQVNEFIANNPKHPIVIEYQRGNIGLGYIIRNWKEIHNEDYSNQWQGQSRENNPS
jgi:hypothetical protein